MKNDLTAHTWTSEGINTITGTKYDHYGYTQQGYDVNLFNRFGDSAEESSKYYVQGKVTKRSQADYGYGFDENGCGENGWDFVGCHAFTGDQYDNFGLDYNLVDRCGWLRYEDRSVDAITHHEQWTLNQITGTLFDPAGYDRFGFSADGIHCLTGENHDENGKPYPGAHERDGFGYTLDGWSRNELHRVTGNFYDEDGYDMWGFDWNNEHVETEGKYDLLGYDADGLNESGFGRDGWNAELINEATGTIYDEDGFTKAGQDSEGYSRDGFKDGWNREGINLATGTLFNSNDHDIDEFHKNGWKWVSHGVFINKETGTRRDSTGFDRWGYDESGYSKAGYNDKNWNREGLNGYTGTRFNGEGWSEDGSVHKETGTAYSPEHLTVDGYDCKGLRLEDVGDDSKATKLFDREGFDTRGYGRDGLGRDGLDKFGFDSQCKHPETGTVYDPKGYDFRGFHKNTGISRNGKKRVDTGTRQFASFMYFKRPENKLAETASWKNGRRKIPVAPSTV